MISKVDIGSRIRGLRKKAGLRQVDLAKKLKPKPVTKETICRIETGKYNYSIDLLFKIAEALDCDISDLCSSEKTPKRMSMFEGALQDYTRRIIEEEKAKSKKNKTRRFK